MFGVISSYRELTGFQPVEFFGGRRPLTPVTPSKQSLRKLSKLKFKR